MIIPDKKAKGLARTSSAGAEQANMGWFASIILAACLTVTSSLRAFPTLLVVCAISRFELIGAYRLPSALHFLENDIVLYILVVLAILEVTNDKVRSVAVFSNTFITFLRPVAAVVSSIAVLPMGDKQVQSCVLALSLGLFLGSPLIRLRSRCLTNPLDKEISYSNRTVSLAEDALAPLSAFLAFLQPMLILALTLAYTIFLISLRQKALDRKMPFYQHTDTPKPTDNPSCMPIGATSSSGYGKLDQPSISSPLAQSTPAPQNKRRL